jgi:hypothetical protein
MRPDNAAELAKKKTSGRFDDQIDDIEQKIESFLGMDTQ